MPPKEKASRKGVASFKWDDKLTTLLLRICQERQKKHGYGQPFNWNDILKIFKEKTGLETTGKIARNKFEHVKKFWRAWDDLKNKETGCGWDEKLNTASATDCWWDKKIKERPEYRRFREGIDHETTDLWTEIFAGIVATGKRCVAPTMDPSAIPADEEEGGGAGEFDWEQELEEVGGEQLGTPLGGEQLGTPHEVDLTGLTMEDDGDDELIGGTMGGNNVGFGQQGKGKRARTTFEGSPNPVPRRKGKRLSNSQSTYNQHLEMMGQTSEKLFSMLDVDDEGSSHQKKGRKVHDLDDALPVIEEMVEKGVIVEGGELWCIAMAEVLNEESRELFMRLKSDFARISWLEFRLTHKRA